ncbi:hypothetical protein BC834DRAFT_976697 [Gloeopeniophorella convolvens]|nr:hypothetical protein BC834DRAFT_976697 [Gloeopeniophorella convolvens]
MSLRPHPVPLVDNPQEYLATKWVDSDELHRLNIPYIKGPFSLAERDQIDAAIHSYQEAHGPAGQEHALSNDQVVDLILLKQQTGFWPHVACAVPMRPLRSVFNHVRQARGPFARSGGWSTLAGKGLEQAVQDHGRQWDKVALAVGRTPEDARAHFVTKLEHSEHKSGPWSADEEMQFLTVVQGLTFEGRSFDLRGFWAEVSRRMNHTRTMRQCKHKWDAQFRARVVGGGKKPAWTATDDFILVQKIRSCKVDAESLIDWNSLRDEGWNAWSPLALRKKWGALRARVSVEGATHQDIVRELAQLIVLPSTPLP